VAFATLFLVANRGAYRGYFQDDEIDNLLPPENVGTKDCAHERNTKAPEGPLPVRALAS
jgi:hypothetical protein